MLFRIGENVFIIQIPVPKTSVFYKKFLFSTEFHLHSVCGLPARVCSLNFFLPPSEG